MKNLFFTTLLFLLSIGITLAQTDVTLNIHHKLGDNPFSLSSATTNNMGHNFDVTRLQYYVSEISVIHDGGTETMIEDLYLLIDASESAATTVSLGNLPVTNVEGIKFHIGVDETSNHANPVSWPVGHPLAPVSPSMHWGWTAGYRFIAYEGNGGTGLDQLFQLHGLGDSNYHSTEVSLAATAENGSVDINLDADYARGLEDISLNGGVIVHGETGAARLAIENFRDYVFSPSTSSVSNIDISEINSFELFPNPSFDGKSNILINSAKDLEYELSIVDILGREISHLYNVASNTRIELDLDNKGIYFISLVKDGQAVLNRKLVVQ